MMGRIINKNIEIKKIPELTSEYIESQFEILGLDVVRWAIVKAEGDVLTINAAVIV